MKSTYALSCTCGYHTSDDLFEGTAKAAAELHLGVCNGPVTCTRHAHDSETGVPVIVWTAKVEVKPEEKQIPT